MKTCIKCNKKLVGRQVKFCSKRCKSAYYNASSQSYKKQRNKGLERKLALLSLFGGCCSKCGYNKNIAALSFHHLRDRSFGLDSRSLSNRSWNACLEEARKCILVCANCHMEIHHPSF